MSQDPNIQFTGVPGDSNSAPFENSATNSVITDSSFWSGVDYKSTFSNILNSLSDYSISSSSSSSSTSSAFDAPSSDWSGGNPFTRSWDDAGSSTSADPNLLQQASAPASESANVGHNPFLGMGNVFSVDMAEVERLKASNAGPAQSVADFEAAMFKTRSPADSHPAPQKPATQTSAVATAAPKLEPVIQKDGDGYKGPPRWYLPLPGKSFQLMTKTEMSTVLRLQLAYLEQCDPFAHDFYFNAYSARKGRLGASGRAIGSQLVFPLTGSSRRMRENAGNGADNEKQSDEKAAEAQADPRAQLRNRIVVSEEQLASSSSSNAGRQATGNVLGRVSRATSKHPRKLMSLSASTDDPLSPTTASTNLQAPRRTRMFAGLTIAYLIEASYAATIAVEDVDSMLASLPPRDVLVDGSTYQAQHRDLLARRASDCVALTESLDLEYSFAAGRREETDPVAALQTSAALDVAADTDFDQLGQSVMFKFLQLAKGRLVLARALIFLGEPTVNRLLGAILSRFPDFIAPKTFTESDNSLASVLATTLLSSPRAVYLRSIRQFFCGTNCKPRVFDALRSRMGCNLVQAMLKRGHQLKHAHLQAHSHLGSLLASDERLRREYSAAEMALAQARGRAGQLLEEIEASQAHLSTLIRSGEPLSAAANALEGELAIKKAQARELAEEAKAHHDFVSARSIDIAQCGAMCAHVAPLEQNLLSQFNEWTETLPYIIHAIGNRVEELCAGLPRSIQSEEWNKYWSIPEVASTVPGTPSAAEVSASGGGADAAPASSSNKKTLKDVLAAAESRQSEGDSAGNQAILFEGVEPTKTPVPNVTADQRTCLASIEAMWDLLGSLAYFLIPEDRDKIALQARAMLRVELNSYARIARADLKAKRETARQERDKKLAAMPSFMRSAAQQQPIEVLPEPPHPAVAHLAAIALSPTINEEIANALIGNVPRPGAGALVQGVHMPVPQPTTITQGPLAGKVMLPRPVQGPSQPPSGFGRGANSGPMPGMQMVPLQQHSQHFQSLQGGPRS